MLYYILAFIWFIFFTRHIKLINNNTKEEYTAYNNIIVVILCAFIGISWIISIPLYVLRMERV